MILEDERHLDVHEFENPKDPPLNTNRDIPEIQEIMKRYDERMDEGTYRNLQNNLVEHHWNLKGARLGPYKRHRGH
jgi:hypothetical protein